MDFFKIFQNFFLFFNIAIVDNYVDMWKKPTKILTLRLFKIFLKILREPLSRTKIKQNLFYFLLTIFLDMGIFYVRLFRINFLYFKIM